MHKKIVLILLAWLGMALVASAADKRFTLIIDPGHGGNDHGAPGSTSKEKDLTLRYGLALGAFVEKNCPDVRVVYTRRTDVFIPLHKRAEIANQNKADLFISVHINALDHNHTAHGFQSYTLGRGERSGERGIKENIDVAKRENSVIYLEKDYQTTYRGFDDSAESDIMFEFIADKNRERSVEFSRLLQREVCKATGRVDGGSHQNNLAVLRLTSMPAVLLELGFISTPDEEQYLNTNEALDRFVKGIYNAFIYYKNAYDTHISVPYRDSRADESGKIVDVAPLSKTTPTTTQKTQKSTAKEQKSIKKATNGAPKQTANTASRQPSATPQQAQVDKSKPVFKVQIFTSTRVLRSGDTHFKGLDGCDYYEDGNIKKYTYGASNNYNEIYQLRKQLVEKFPECFIIAFKNGQKMDVNEGIREFKANKNK